MTTLTVSEDGPGLSELIDRVLGGDDVVISREGRPVARLHSVAPPAAEPRRVSEAGLAWLKAHRPVGSMPDEDAGVTVSRMRDEDTH